MASSSHDDDDTITGINVTPLVDVTLVLLIIFMVTASFIVAPAILTNAVGVRTAEARVLACQDLLGAGAGKPVRQLDLSLPDLVIPGRPLKEQAEFTKLPADYLPDKQLSGLAKAGRQYLSTYADTLQKIEADYGVPGNVVIAVWGRETDYGAERQRHNVIRSLATEAYLAAFPSALDVNRI